MATTGISSADWWKIGFILIGFIILSMLSAYNRTMGLMYYPRPMFAMGGKREHSSDIFEPPSLNPERLF